MNTRISENSTFQTFNVNAIGENSSSLVEGSDEAVRALVRNVSGTDVFLSYQSANLTINGAPTLQTFRLPPNESETFVVAPRQQLFASAIGKAGVVSVAISAAKYGV